MSPSRVVALLVVLGLALAVPCAPAQPASPAGRVHRVALLGAGSAVPAADRQAFEQALRERGWAAGANLVIEARYADGRFGDLPALAADLVRREPDVIVAFPTAAARAARDATRTIPIVMLFVSDPVGEGLVASVARPGGNVTGLTMTPTWEIFAKQLQLLAEAVPLARRVAFLWNPANPAAAPAARTVEQAARTLGLELQVVAARGPEELEPAFRAMAAAQAEALLVISDPMFFAQRARLAALAARHRLPAMYGNSGHARAGGLMEYAANRTDTYRRAAGYVDRLLRGASPADLSVEEPARFELVVNLRAARALGLALPAALQGRADELIR